MLANIKIITNLLSRDELRRNDMLKKTIVPAIVFLILMLFASSLHSQYKYNKYIPKYISVEKDEMPKTFIDLLFELNPVISKQKDKKVKKDYYSPATSKVKQDTSGKQNRITSLRDGGDIFYLYLELVDRENQIKIDVYNMLGKKVLDVYDGWPLPNGTPYEIIISGPPSLPNGVYLCVVVGSNFRLREKFVISRR